jgi:hypothetical protein
VEEVGLSSMSGTGENAPAIRCFGNPATRFKPGQSGNPKGRPKKVRELAAIADENSEKAMRKLAKLIDSDDDRVALAAAQALLDRSLGKPTQTNVNVNKSDVADLDLAELYAIAKSGSEGDNPTPGSEREPDPVH